MRVKERMEWTCRDKVALASLIKIAWVDFYTTTRRVLTGTPREKERWSGPKSCPEKPPKKAAWSLFHADTRDLQAGKLQEGSISIITANIFWEIKVNRALYMNYQPLEKGHNNCNIFFLQVSKLWNLPLIIHCGKSVTKMAITVCPTCILILCSGTV